MAPISRLLWGPTYENEVRIGYPVFDFLSDREERDGSKHETSAAGVDSSWIIGRDFTLDAEVRWIPDSPNTNPVQTALSGPVSWQEFLDWARDAHTFRFVPDETVPDFYLDNVALVEPRKGFGSLSPDIKRNVRLKLRNPTTDFHQALRGIQFDYAPGAIEATATATADRATAGTYRGRPGSLLATIGASAAVNVLRDRHYVGTTRTTLLEPAGTQLIANPENFGAWSISEGTPGRTSGQADPFGGTAAYLLDDNDAASLERIYHAVTFTADGEKCVAVFVRQGTSTVNRIALFDVTAAVTRHEVSITWSNGTPTLATVSGSGTRFPPVPWGGGWWRVPVSVVGVVAANTNRLILNATDGTAASTGTLYVFGANAWNATVPASYQGPSLATRAGDGLYFSQTILPQATFLYVQYVNLGVGVDPSDWSTSYLASLGDGSPRLLLAGGNTGMRVQHQTSAGAVEATAAGTWAYGDVIEGLAVLQADGAVQAVYSKNGGAEVASTLSATWSLPASWWLNRIRAFANPLGLIRLTIGPLVWGGLTRNTIARVRAA